MAETLKQQELEQQKDMIVIEDDLPLRYRTIAETLGIEYTTDMEDWLLTRTAFLERLLAEYSSSPITVTDMEIVRDELQAAVDLFCRQTMDDDNIPVVISFDPLLVDNASYIMQENRVSCVSSNNPTIDLAEQPKGKCNRFAEQTADPRSGAGKSIEQQIAEFCDQLEGVPLEKIRLAVVDGSIISGRTILRFLSQLPPELQTNGVLAITGSTSQKGVQLMNENNVGVQSLTVFDQEPTMTITLSDLIPTLGGRMIAQREFDDSLSPLTLDVNGRPLTMAVDSVIGGYPSHVDLDPFETGLLENVRQWALQTGYGFWDSLEQMRGEELTWNDLRILNGKLKVMVPMRQGMSVGLNTNDIPNTPKETLVAAARFAY